MTLLIPARQLTGAALRAAWGELLDTDLDVAASLCGYVDERGCPDVEQFKQALLIQIPNL